MKAERRHELKHNELADWLGEQLETYKPHATGILIGGLVLLAIVLGSLWFLGGENQASAKAWSDYFGAFNEREPEKALENLATKQSGSQAAWWALASVGDMNLGEATALLYSDRNEARKRLEKAEAAYKQVETIDDPILKSRARLGLAQVYESLCKPEEARKYYELVAQNSESAAIREAAAASGERMKQPREIEFLDWFARQTPKKPAPMPGIGSGLPNLPGDLPDRPDISLPGGLGLDNLGTGTPPAPAPTFPAPGKAAPGTVPSADAKTADEPNEANAKKTDTKATDAKAPEVKASEGKSPEAEPADSQPSKSNPAETKSGQVKPTEAKSSEVKSSSTQPAKTEPARENAKTNDTKNE